MGYGFYAVKKLIYESEFWAILQVNQIFLKNILK